MRKPTIAFLLVVAALAVAVATHDRSPHAPPAAAHDTPAPVKGADETPAAAPARMAADRAFVAAEPAPVPADPALFDGDLPLAGRIAELDRRARAGDVAAGCQLGVELVICDGARNMASHHENIDGQVRMLANRNLSPEQLRRETDFLLRRQADNRARLAVCEGVAPVDWAAPARYLHLAARQGHLPSMRLFLERRLYWPDQLFRDPGLIPLFRVEAPRYFRALLEAGDRSMLDRVQIAGAGTNGDMLLEVLPPPWNSRDVADEVLRLDVLAAGATGEPTRRAAVDPAVIAEARRIHDAWFRGTPREREGDSHPDHPREFGCERLAGAAP